MKIKVKRFLIWFVSSLILSALIFYFGVAFFYSEGFVFGTKINDFYCTGMSVEDVNDYFIKTIDYSEVYLTYDGITETVDTKDIDLSVSFMNGLNSIYCNQKPILWIKNLFTPVSIYDLNPEVSFDESKLSESLNKLDVVAKYNDENAKGVTIEFNSENGFYLDTGLDKTINYNELLQFTEDNLYDFKLNISVEPLFKEAQMDQASLKQVEIFDEASAFLDNTLIYDMGAEEITVNAAVLSTFLVYDSKLKDFKRNDDGSLFVDESKVLEFIDALCDKYYTYKQPREYTTFNGDVKEINLSVYGTEIDKNFEETYFLNAIENGISERHIPKYVHEAYVRGLNDIGDTFIEVDLTNQVLYYVSDGSLAMTCDIVSGKPSNGNATPEIVAYVRRKSKNTYLRGEGYVSFVKYWMPFYSGDGFHDANWQSRFGGDWYIKHGSHGCINMKTDEAEALYNAIEVGIPVIIYK